MCESPTQQLRPRCCHTLCTLQGCCYWPVCCGSRLASWCWACLASTSVFAPAQTADTMLSAVGTSSHDSCVSLCVSVCNSHPSLCLSFFYEKNIFFIATPVCISRDEAVSCEEQRLKHTHFVRATFICVALILLKSQCDSFCIPSYFAVSSMSSLSVSKNDFSPPVQTVFFF